MSSQLIPSSTLTIKRTDLGNSKRLVLFHLNKHYLFFFVVRRATIKVFEYFFGVRDFRPPVILP